MGFPSNGGVSIALHEPFNTIDKTDLEMGHHDFNDIEIAPTGKVSGQMG